MHFQYVALQLDDFHLLAQWLECWLTMQDVSGSKLEFRFRFGWPQCAGFHFKQKFLSKQLLFASDNYTLFMVQHFASSRFNILPNRASTFYQSTVQHFTKSCFCILSVHGSTFYQIVLLHFISPWFNILSNRTSTFYQSMI